MRRLFFAIAALVVTSISTLASVPTVKWDKYSLIIDG